MNGAAANPTPELMAHRGYAARWPENTFESLQAAVRAGVRLLEFDVQLSRDGVPFLLHDADFARTGGRPVSMLDLDATEAEAIAVGEPQRFGGAFAGVRAPRLARVAAGLLSWPQVTAFVELKHESILRFGRETMLDAVLEALGPALARCVLISFDAGIIRLARERCRRPIGWALARWDAGAESEAARLAPEYLFCNWKRLPPAPLPLWAGPWTWVIYEVTDQDMARSLAGRGVGIIETMACAELAAALDLEQSA